MYLLKPEVFDPNSQTVEEFKKTHDVQTVVDSYGEQLEELFLIRNPRFRFIPDRQKEIAAFSEEQLAGKTLEQHGSWFYFSWDKTLVHYLPDAIFQEIRTARNKNLILQDEQDKFYNSTIAFAGLSVGSHAALTVAMMGGAKNIKIADPDTISPSNLNRVRYGATAIGMNKSLIAGRIIVEMNPYANVYVYDEGVTEANKDEYFLGSDLSPKADLFVEEIDNLAMKIGLRIEARKHKIPVIMATDNGDGVIADIERFDLEPDLMLFNGALGDITMDDFKNFAPSDMPKLATKVAGPDMVTSRMQASLLEVGKTLYSWPQLGSAATFSGVVIAYLARRVLCGDNIKSGKYDLSLDAILDGDYDTDQAKIDRKNHREQFFKTIGLE